MDYPRIERWDFWTGLAVRPKPWWFERILFGSTQLREYVMAAVWPREVDEFERALQTVASAAHGASQFIVSKCIYDESRAVYQVGSVSDPIAYQAWEAKADAWLAELAKAMNWFADCVRRYFNPTFRALDGKYLLDFSALVYEAGDRPVWPVQRSELHEYSAEERAQQPALVRAKETETLADLLGTAGGSER